MTSFRFHTNFTNPLKMTNLATSPTKSNYPKLLLIPQHQRAGVQPQAPQLHGHRCCCSRGQATANFHWSQGFLPGPGQLVPRGNRRDSSPSPHLVKNRAHIGANLQSTQHPVDRMTRRLLVKITVSLRRYSLSCSGSLQIRIFKIRHPNIRLQGTANNAVTRSGSASKELTYKTST